MTEFVAVVMPRRRNKTRKEQMGYGDDKEDAIEKRMKRTKKKKEGHRREVSDRKQWDDDFDHFCCSCCYCCYSLLS